jgi:PAS domain S-box-containing protein
LGLSKYASICSFSFSPASPSVRILLDEVQRVQNKQNLDSSTVDLSHSEADLEFRAAAVEATANAVVITDLNGMVVWVNPAFERLTGYAEAEMVGQSTRVLNSGQNPRTLYEETWRTITGQTELCWVLQTAHVVLEADLTDWKTGNGKQLAVFVQNESDFQ